MAAPKRRIDVRAFLINAPASLVGNGGDILQEVELYSSQVETQLQILLETDVFVALLGDLLSDCSQLLLS